MSRFTEDPQSTRRVVNRTGDGVNRSNAPQFLDGSSNPIPSYEVSVKENPGHGSDSTITHTGPGQGVPPGIGRSTDMQGFVSPTGNRVMIDNTFGADKIILQHHTGATIIIDPDGSIHMISASKKGVGVVAPKGDVTIAGRNHLILKGDGRITLETDGNLDINVGGSMHVHVKGDYVTSVEGSVEMHTEGSMVNDVVKDVSQTIGGDNRITVAGNMRTQVTNNKRVDVGKDHEIREDGKFIHNTGKTHFVDSKEDMSFETKAAYYRKSDGLQSISSKDTYTMLADGAVTVTTKDTYTMVADGAVNLSSKADFDMKSAGKLKGSSTGTADWHASGHVDIRGARTDINEGPGEPKSPDDAQDTLDTADVPQAEYATSETIIDHMTTTRVAPDFPHNAKRMSKSEFSTFENEGQTPNPKAKAAAASNQGAGTPPTIKDAGQTAEPVAQNSYDKPAGVTSNGKAEQNPLPIPTSVYNSNEKISRHITVGQIMRLREVPAANQKAVITEAMNVAWNIMDPIIDKFGGRVRITSWYRNNSSNHIKGGAIDMCATNKHDVQLTAEIAAFIRDNLPHGKLMLERNDSPGIHIHAESAPVGSGKTREPITCADPQCRTSTPGIQLSYAVAALKQYTGQA